MRRQYCPICGMPIMKTSRNLYICSCGWNSESYRKKVFERINGKAKENYFIAEKERKATYAGK